MAAEQLDTGQQVIRLFVKARRVENAVRGVIRAAQGEVHHGMTERARLLGQGLLTDLMAEQTPGFVYDGVEELDSGLLVSRNKLEAGQAAESALPELKREVATQIRSLLDGTRVTAVKTSNEGLVFGRRNVGHTAVSSGLGITHGLDSVRGTFIEVDDGLRHVVVTHEDSDFEWVVSPLPMGVAEEPQASLQVERPGGESAI